MIGLLSALFVSAAIIGGILLARYLRRQSPSGYRRRFKDRHGHADQSLYPPTIFATGMDSTGHHHHQHSPDCSTHSHSHSHSDSGSGCADGGGGGGGGSD